MELDVTTTMLAWVPDRLVALEILDREKATM